jgi:hypothetical protein
MDILNARELAALAWSLVFVALVIVKSEIRSSFFEVVRCALHPKLVFIYFISLLWTGLTVFLLFKLGGWDVSLAKDTVIWAIGSGVVLTVSSVAIKDAKAYFRRITKELIAFTVFFEFVLNAYPFHFWIEFAM